MIPSRHKFLSNLWETLDKIMIHLASVLDFMHHVFKTCIVIVILRQRWISIKSHSG